MADVKHDARTVIVKGVNFDSSDATVEAAFSEIGPVRNCFLVKQQGQQRHKGYGFVQFALPEDAKRAVESLSNTLLEGRKIQVESAIKRAPLDERKKRKRGLAADGGEKVAEADGTAAPAAATTTAGQGAASSSRRQGEAAGDGKQGKAKRQKLAVRPPPTPAVAAKQRLVRTVAVGGVTAATRAQALALAHSAGKVEEVVQQPAAEAVEQALLRRDGCPDDILFVVYDSVKAALGAVAALHGQGLQPAAPAAKRKGRGKAAAESGTAPGGAGGPATQLWARQVSGEGLHMKKWRLIIRNLDFEVTEAELRKALQAAGFVWELSIARGPDGRSRGFGFAGFTSRAHAERAIALLNGKAVGKRLVVVDWAVPKAQYKATAAEAAPSGDQGKAGTGPDAASPPEPSASSDGEKFQDGGETGSEEDGDDMTAADREGNADVEDLQRDQSTMQSALAGILASHDPQPSVPARPATRQKAQAAKPDEASEPAEARNKAKLQAVPATNEGNARQPAKSPSAPSATVFVRGLPLDVTQQQLHAALQPYGTVASCRLVLNKATQKPKGTAFVEFKEPGSAHRAAAACAQGRMGQGAGVVVGGRAAEVDVALSQEEARGLALEKAGIKNMSKDNRNIYLSKEGHVEEGSAAWADMSEGDRTRRKRAAEEKNSKLRSPNFFVSQTRLAVRNIPPAMRERELKQLFIDAVRKRAVKAIPHVKQVKVLRDAEKADTAGQPKSKGRGFVEFTEHEHALCALRQLNNNPGIFSKDRRPIVEFAIENVKMLKKRASQQAMYLAKAKDEHGPPGSRAQGRRPREQTPAHAKRMQQGGAKAPAQGKPGRKPAPAAAKSANQSKASQKAGEHEAAATKAVSPKPRPAERAVAARKRKADASIDALAQAGGSTDIGADGRRHIKPRKNTEKTDNLDKLVSQYRAKYFNSAVGTRKQQKSGDQGSKGLSRWFE